MLGELEIRDIVYAFEEPIVSKTRKHRHTWTSTPTKI